jgi:2-polyprenyl-3-methyl-5-hydroxy-6-metoxy-1,4-benzoquinol methylase
MKRSARSAGAVGTKAVVPRWIRERVEPSPHIRILDLGAETGTHANSLRRLGYNVTAFDINFPEHSDPNALKRTYDIVYMSNVLNVQPSAEALMELLQAVRRLIRPEGFLLANYASSPHYAGLGNRDVDDMVRSVFRSVSRVEKEVGYSSPLFWARK